MARRCVIDIQITLARKDSPPCCRQKQITGTLFGQEGKWQTQSDHRHMAWGPNSYFLNDTGWILLQQLTALKVQPPHMAKDICPAIFCQNWSQFDAKFQMDYYFSDPDFTTATGTSEIPVRAVLNGSAGMPGRMWVLRLSHSHRNTHFIRSLYFLHSGISLFSIPSNSILYWTLNIHKHFTKHFIT